MKMTAAEQLELGIVDAVIEEPGEGAHTDPSDTARRIKEIVLERLDALGRMSIDDLVEARYERYRAYGPFTIVGPARGSARTTRHRRSFARPAHQPAVHAALPANAAHRPVGPRGGVGDAHPRTGPERVARTRPRSTETARSVPAATTMPSTDSPTTCCRR